jgi:hypothetical protein
MYIINKFQIELLPNKTDRNIMFAKYFSTLTMHSKHDHVTINIQQIIILL